MASNGVRHHSTRSGARGALLGAAADGGALDRGYLAGVEAAEGAMQEPRVVEGPRVGERQAAPERPGIEVVAEDPAQQGGHADTVRHHPDPPPVGSLHRLVYALARPARVARPSPPAVASHAP